MFIKSLVGSGPAQVELNLFVSFGAVKLCRVENTHFVSYKSESNDKENSNINSYVSLEGRWFLLTEFS